MVIKLHTHPESDQVVCWNEFVLGKAFRTWSKSLVLGKEHPVTLDSLCLVSILILCLWNSSHIVGDWSNLFIPELKITQQSQRASENNRITSWIAKTLCIIICIYMLVSHPRALFVLAKFDVASFVRAASFCLILRFARSDVQSKPLDGNRWMIISYWMTSELVIFFLTTNHSVTNIGGIILPRRHGHMLRLSSSVEMYSSLASLQLRRFDQFTRASMKYMFFLQIGFLYGFDLRGFMYFMSWFWSNTWKFLKNVFVGEDSTSGASFFSRKVIETLPKDWVLVLNLKFLSWSYQMTYPT